MTKKKLDKLNGLDSSCLTFSTRCLFECCTLHKLLLQAFVKDYVSLSSAFPKSFLF